MHIKSILFSSFIAVLWLVFFFSGCANVRPPTGGDKDTIPPRLINTLPSQKSTGFVGNEIQFFFNENIEVKDLKKQLIIAPFIDNKYMPKVKKNVLSLVFEEDLKKDITYTLNLRSGVVDMNEKNPSENAQVVFSTGDYIDSTYIRGMVFDTYTGQPVEEVAVMLFEANDSLQVEGGTPYYVAKSDTSGIFRLENLSRGNYRIYALQEKDEDLKYSKREEKISFLKDTIFLADNIDSLIFFLADYDNKDLKFIKAATTKQYIDLNFNKVLLDYKLSFEGKWDSLIYHISQGEKIRLFNTGPIPEDSILTTIYAIDSIGNAIDTTQLILFDSPKKKEEMAFSFATLKPAGQIEPNTKFRFEINFNKPVKFFNLDSLIYINDKDTISIDSLNLRPGPNFTSLFSDSISTNEKASLAMLKGAFISVENDTSEAKLITASIRDLAKTGILEGEIITERESFVVQLVSSNFKLEAEVKNTKKFRFEGIPAGSKYIRILIDENNDGEWSKGNFKEGIPAEPVLTFPPEPIELKENWELRDIIIEF